MELSLKIIREELANLSKRKKIFVAIVFSIIMVVSSLAVMGFIQSTTSQQPPLTGPLTTGHITFTNGSATVFSFTSISNQVTNHYEIGSVEAFMVSPMSANTLNTTGIPHVSNNYKQIGETQLSSNGFFNMSLNYSFYTYANQWAGYLNKTKANSTEISIMYEINYEVYKNNKTFLYTFPQPYLFSPREFRENSLYHRNLFSINKNFVLGQPAEIINGTPSPNANPDYIPEPGGGKIIVTTYSYYSWETNFANSFTGPLPLMIVTGSNLNINNGYVTFEASLGAIKNHESFSSSNGFTNSTTCINNVNNWHFVESTGGTVSLGAFSGISKGIPNPTIPSSNNSVDIYLSNISVEVTGYELYNIQVTQEFENGFLIHTMTSSTPTGDVQYQQEIINDAGKGTTLRAGSFDKNATQAFEYLYNGSSQDSMGQLSTGNTIQFYNITNTLNAGVNSAEMQNIANTISMAVATLGIMTTAAAALDSVPQAATPDIIAMAVSFAGVFASIAAAVQSVGIAANDTTTIYGSSLTSSYSQTLDAQVYLDPTTFQISGYTFFSASPLITLSTAST
jgi:hypothetical protein